MGTYKFEIEGTEYEVGVGSRKGNVASVTVNGKKYEVQIKGAAAPVAEPSASPEPEPVAPVTMGGGPSGAVAAPGSGDVVAPISGVILRIAVRSGQSVKTGDLLLILEAMKMENEIFAPIDGVVTEISVQPQQDVQQGEMLLTIGSN